MATATVSLTRLGELKCNEGREASKNGLRQQAIELYTEALEAFNKTDDKQGQKEVAHYIRNEQAYARREQKIKDYTAELQTSTKTIDTNREEELKELIRCEEEMLLGDKKNVHGFNNFYGYNNSKKQYVYVAKRAFQDAIKHYKNGQSLYAEAEANRNTAECLRSVSMVKTAAKYDKEANRLFALCKNP